MLLFWTSSFFSLLVNTGNLACVFINVLHLTLLFFFFPSYHQQLCEACRLRAVHPCLNRDRSIMRFNAAAAVSAAALLAGSAHADDAQKVLNEETETPTSAPELATFTVSTYQFCFDAAWGLAHVLLIKAGPKHLSAVLIELDIAENWLLTGANGALTLAHQHQGRVPRAVHRRLGRPLEGLPCEEGYWQ